MFNLKKTALTAVIITTCTAAPLMAYEAGDFVARVGAAGVYPTGESDDLDAVPGGKVEADNAWSLGLSFTYMFTDNVGVGVLGAYPFKHDIKPKGTLKDIDSRNVGDTKHLPPTVTLQWHIPTGTNFNPYLGAGINYTYFFDQNTKGLLEDTGANLDIDDSWGWAAEGGVDYLFANDWLVSGQVWYASIEPDADIMGGTLGLNERNLKVKIDPWIFMVSVGKRF